MTATDRTAPETATKRNTATSLSTRAIGRLTIAASGRSPAAASSISRRRSPIPWPVGVDQEPAEAEAAHRVDQRIEGDGLHQIRLRSQFERSVDVLGLGGSRQHH